LTQILTNCRQQLGRGSRGLLLKGNHLPNAVCNLQIIAEVDEANKQSPCRSPVHPYFILFPLFLFSL